MCQIKIPKKFLETFVILPISTSVYNVYKIHTDVATEIGQLENDDSPRGAERRRHGDATRFNPRAVARGDRRYVLDVILGGIGLRHAWLTLHVTPLTFSTLTYLQISKVLYAYIKPRL